MDKTLIIVGIVVFLAIWLLGCIKTNPLFVRRTLYNPDAESYYDEFNDDDNSVSWSMPPPEQYQEEGSVVN